MTTNRTKSEARTEAAKLASAASQLSRRSQGLLHHAEKTHDDFAKLKRTAKKLHATANSELGTEN